MLFSFILKKGKILNISVARVRKCLSFFIFRLSNVLSVNDKSLFKLSSGLSNIFLIATAADNYIYKLGSFAIEIRFQNKWLVPNLEFKEFSFYNIITTKATFFAFCCFESWFSLFKLDGCLMQSIDLRLANILPKVFELWRFLCISLIFGNTFGLLGLYVDINGKISSFQFFTSKLLMGNCESFFNSLFTNHFWIFLSFQNCS